MTQQYSQQQVPSVRLFNEKDATSSVIDIIDVLEVSVETKSHIATHPGEDGTVFADTRVRMPVRYRAVLVFHEIWGQNSSNMKDAQKNLLDASYSPACKYTVTSYFSRCWNMMVVSSTHRDTPDMQGLRIQDVVFEECMEYETTGIDLAKCEDGEQSSDQVQAAQLMTPSEDEEED